MISVSVKSLLYIPCVSTDAFICKCSAGRACNKQVKLKVWPPLATVILTVYPTMTFGLVKGYNGKCKLKNRSIAQEQQHYEKMRSCTPRGGMKRVLPWIASYSGLVELKFVFTNNNKMSNRRNLSKNNQLTTHWFWHYSSM